MDVWESYLSRTEATGSTPRERLLTRTQGRIMREIAKSLSKHEVLINGKEQTVAVLNDKSDKSTKEIRALPGESLVHGGIVDFANSKWLITELDANDEVYASGTMCRCNHLLKWLNDDGVLIEKWSIVEDGTKYLIGENSSDLMSVGDARIAVTVGKDDDTNGLRRGKRFLIDDEDAGEDSVLAYQITKPNKLYNVYDGAGIFRFILKEVSVTDNDNVELRVADYYKGVPPYVDPKKHRGGNGCAESGGDELLGGWI